MKLGYLLALLVRVLGLLRGMLLITSFIEKVYRNEKG